MALTVRFALGYEDHMETETAEQDAAPPAVDHPAVRRTLIGAGEKLSLNSRNKILALGNAAVPILLEILDEEDLHLEDSPGQGWAPIHSVELLGELHAVEAIEPLLKLLPNTNFDEIINGKIIRALESIGQAALEPILKAYADNAERDFRAALSSVLSGLKVRDERIFTILLDELGREPGFGAGHVAEYGDPRAVPALLRAFDEHEIKTDDNNPLANHDLAEIKAAIEDLGGELNDIQKARYARAMKPADEWRAKMNDLLGSRAQASRPLRAQPKLGRNDPCRCGSGKKYKKCCLASDERERSAAPRIVERSGTPFLASADVDDATIDGVAAEFFEQKARGRGPAQQMADFAQPLIDASKGDLPAVQNAMSLGALFWNLAVCKDEKQREEMLTDAITNTMKSEQDQAEFRRLADTMVERHRKMFPEMHR